MPRTTALDPLFTAVDAPSFTDRYLATLAAGTLAAVRVPGFLDEAACAAALAAAARLPTADYDASRVPTPIVRFGPALNDYRGPGGRLQAARYWRDAEAARAAWQRAGMRPGPIAVCLARLGCAWGTAVAAATIDGRQVFGGTLREINAGALVHYDDINREFPAGLFDQQVLAQLAFNVWVSAPESGGTSTGVTAGSPPTNSTATPTVTGARRSSTASASMSGRGSATRCCSTPRTSTRSRRTPGAGSRSRSSSA
ncbi:proline hydroxylase [Streptomyces sp. CC224B]|uniref:proline hydroxylase n=1 Tax=Streptomyces sp. CC224B TaxID=3044571 RepID=UPI0024A7B333|nr:proline hydroxylase [Streptomyces sp. CC224B]